MESQPHSNLLIVMAAANIKFGRIIAMHELNKDEWHLAIVRDQPVFPGLAAMTIRASIENDQPFFYWGHYDLTQVKAWDIIRGIDS